LANKKHDAPAATKARKPRKPLTALPGGLARQGRRTPPNTIGKGLPAASPHRTARLAGQVPASTGRKLRKLEALLAPWRKVAIAFSAGVDSTFLLATLCRDPKRRVLAITALSALHPTTEQEEARRTARRLGAEHREIRLDPLRIEAIRSNPPDRCYHCKRALFSRMQDLRRREGCEVLVEGSNLDDLQDYRPGARALRELGVRSPLQEAGLTKAEIRGLSRRLRLATWKKPAMACLASRIPFGTRITAEALGRIERCEDFLRARVRGPVRVRCHGSTARIEVDPSQLPGLLKKRRRVAAYFKSQGFPHVSVDLEGYRTGSLNPEKTLAT
jgi:pyridinium-3,5-biscarboxylic acid mononucleotide sulfurtransferase